MSAPLNLESDIEDPRAHAAVGNCFLERGEIQFEFGAVARTLNSLMIEADAPSLIDFLSLDVEGAELEVLKGINHTAFRFRYILVECRDLPRLCSFLERWGYSFVEQFSSHDYLFAGQSVTNGSQ